MSRTRLALAACLPVLFTGCGGGGGPGAGEAGSPAGSEDGGAAPAIALTVSGEAALGADAVTLVSSVRVGRTVFDYSYTVHVTNHGTVALADVTGTVTSDAATTVVTDATLAFGGLGPGASATSSGTFTIRQDRSAPLAAANLTITLSGTPPGPAEGVLLEGDPGSPALAAIPDLEPPPVTLADLDGPFILTRITLYIAGDASVAQVNAALTAAAAGIVSAEPGSNRLGIAVPRQTSSVALEALAESLAARPGILLAFPGISTATTLSPNSGPVADDLLHHLRDARLPAAWNAHALAEACAAGQKPVALVVMDRFSRPHDPLYLEIDSAIDPQLPSIVESGVGTVAETDAAGRHGYDVMMTAVAKFDAVSLTGAMPFQQCIDLVGLQIGYETTDDTLKALDRSLNSLDSLGQKAIVNYSLGYAVECPSCPGGIGATSAQFRAASGFTAREILQHHEETALVVASAGNSADKPEASIYRAYGMADFDSAMNVAARSDATASWMTDPSLWQPPTNCMPTCYQSLVATATDRIQFEAELAQLPPGIATPAGNVVIVGSTDGVTNIPSHFSNPTPDIFAVGERIPTLQGPVAGTSFAAPQVAGLATYLWLLSPELRSLPAHSTAQAMIDNRNLATDMIDAYRTILALDSGHALSPAASRVRLAILNVVGDQDPAVGTFDEQDLAEFENAYHPGGATTEPTDPDYGRFDLNGDGYTGGTRRAAFDLDPGSSPAFGRAVQTQLTTDIAGVATTFDENGVTDEQVLCYYAYSPLFEGDTANRDTLLDGRCAPITVTVSPDPGTVATGGTLQFTAAVVGTTDTRVTWRLPNGGGSIDANGLFTAGGTTGTFTVRAESQVNAAASGEATVTVTATVGHVALVDESALARNSTVCSDVRQFDTDPAPGDETLPSGVKIGDFSAPGAPGDPVVSVHMEANYSFAADFPGGASAAMTGSGEGTATLTRPENALSCFSQGFDDFEGGGDAQVSISFIVTGGPVHYAVSGNATETSGPAAGHIELRVAPGGAFVYWQDSLGGSEGAPSGTLAPGTYRMMGLAAASARSVLTAPGGNETERSTFEFTLTLSP